MKKVHLENGIIQGFYDNTIHNNIPDNCIEITDEEHINILENGFNFFENDTFIFKDLRSQEDLNNQRKNEIYLLLDDIDKKKVRAVTDVLINNDLTRLNQLENEADLLRQELKSLQDGTV